MLFVSVKHIGIIRYLMMLGAKLTVDIIDKYPETIGKVLESSIQSHCSDNSSSDQQMDEVRSVNSRYHIKYAPHGKWTLDLFSL